ncbi:MAG: hypothetical protein B6226_04150 [Candidatus Cloacimonetes bacterium 4572_65]|nr:MAG: hypothetical protein B6226_04150 [Candidatus Cloacimonetes bacterium 4572_65]
MIKYYAPLETKYAEVENAENAKWIYLESPSTKEINDTAINYQIPLDFLTDPLDLDETSRIEYDDNFTLIIMRLPTRSGSDDLPFITIPFGIILFDDMVITISNGQNELLTPFMKGINKKFELTKQSFILNVFNRNALLYLTFLKVIDRRISEIETELNNTMRNKELTRLLKLDKCLVYFTTSLKSNEVTLERLQRSRWMHEDVNSDDLLEDVIIDNKQAIEMASIYSNILKRTTESFSSIISNNLNIVMKFLTSITIILMLPTLVASFYGMNVDLPLGHHPFAFWILISLSVLISLIVIIFFLKNKLF